MSDVNITKAVLTADGKVLIKQPDGSYRAATGGTDWDQINARSDEEVEAAARTDPDAPPLDDEFWRNARIVVPPRNPKRHQGMRLDAEVLDWFKAQGPGWQTRMNAVLKSYVEARKRQG
jgi:uncharacterized protein (DUF4415 family)